MKRLLALAAAALLALSASDGTPQQAYIEKYSGIAVSEMQRTGVPASITLAQGLLESRSGLSALAEKSNNHFGIKCHRDWKGRKTYMDDDEKHECFRVYKSAEESFRDHSDFLRYQDRYKSLFELDPTDYRGWAKGLKKAGYATDPGYASKLIKLVEDYGLSRFDGGGEVAVPKTPSEVETPRKVVAAGASKGGYNESVSVQLSRSVYQQNGARFVYALEGETLEGIAASYNLFPREILSFNDLPSSPGPLKAGTVVYVERKKKQAARGVDKYIVGEGSETLRDIAQRFGVQESAVRKMNAFPSGFEPQEGDTVLLRKAR